MTVTGSITFFKWPKVHILGMGTTFVTGSYAYFSYILSNNEVIILIIILCVPFSIIKHLILLLGRDLSFYFIFF